MWALIVWLSVGQADAGEGVRLYGATARPGRTVFDLRVGVMTAPGLGQEAMGQICGSVRPVRRLGVEACGNGAGVLHNRGGADFAHFRLKAEPWQQQHKQTTWALSFAAGFAEVQRSADAPGFRFGEAGEGQVEAAGPEVAIGLSSRRKTGGPGHWVMDLTAGVAHIEGAPAVMDVSGPMVPFVALTMGAGI
tara:strand:- start:527 stop:1102 length:576 start_codon:yes stop_codon:yes gene_type:complete